MSNARRQNHRMFWMHTFQVKQRPTRIRYRTRRLRICCRRSRRKNRSRRLKSRSATLEMTTLKMAVTTERNHQTPLEAQRMRKNWYRLLSVPTKTTKKLQQKNRKSSRREAKMKTIKMMQKVEEALCTVMAHKRSQDQVVKLDKNSKMISKI